MFRLMPKAEGMSKSAEKGNLEVLNQVIVNVWRDFRSINSKKNPFALLVESK